MFLRRKQSGQRVYLQVVENRWEDGRSRQRVVATLGRLDTLLASGELDALVRSAARFSEALRVLDAHDRSETPVVSLERVGPALVFERLWAQTGCQAVVQRRLARRQFAFPWSGRCSDGAAPSASAGLGLCSRALAGLYRLPGTETLQLHHLYRAMAWLGEALPAEAQAGRTPFARGAPRTSSRRTCSATAGTCSPPWTWCSSTPPPCTSRARAERAWASMDTARITGRTSSRWW